MVGTQGGAKVLGRDDVGRIAPGMAADFVAWRTDSLCFSGAQHDLVAALLFCTPGIVHVDLSVINGEVIVKDGEMLTCNVKVSRWLLFLEFVSDLQVVSDLQFVSELQFVSDLPSALQQQVPQLRHLCIL